MNIQRYRDFKARNLFVTDSTTGTHAAFSSITSTTGTFSNIQANNATFNQVNLDTIVQPNLVLQNLELSGDLSVNGQLIVGNDNTFKIGSQFWNILSDRSIKKNIRSLSQDEIKELENLIANLTIKKYSYIDEEIERIGVIADEVEEIYPSAITENSGLKHVNFNDMFYALFAIVKELRKEKDLMQKQIDDLVSRLDKLEKQ